MTHFDVCAFQRRMVESCVLANMNTEFGVNFIWELSKVVRRVAIIQMINTHQIGLSSSARVFRHCPDSVSHIRLWTKMSVPPQHSPRFVSHINPSIEHEAMRVPSWLNVTAVTGSECAGSVFNVLPALAQQAFGSRNPKTHLSRRPTL